MAVDDSYTKLLLHMNGTDNGTTFTDEAGKVLTRVGSTCTKTGTKKFGTASGYFDGDGDYFSIPDSDDFNFGNGNFTIDFWMFLNSTSSYRGLYAQRVTANSEHACTLQIAFSKIEFNWTTYGSDTKGEAFNTTFAAGTWYHIALVRNGASVKLYVNGVADSVTIYIGTDTIYNSAQPILIGAINQGSIGSYLSGYFDEYRVSKGIARWTANFTPPTEEYGAVNYANTGSAVFTATEIQTVSIYGSSVLNWVETKPVNTSVEVYAAVKESLPDTSDYLLCTNGSEIPGLTVGQSFIGKTLFIKAVLSTTDSLVTPSISSLSAMITDSNAAANILLTMKPLKRFNRVVGNAVVHYNAALGSLTSKGGKVLSFDYPFLPTDLIKKDNPYAVENINSVIACSVTVSAIYFLVVGNGDYATTDTRFQKRVSVAVEKASLDNENINAAISNISIVITKVNEQDP